MHTHPITVCTLCVINQLSKKPTYVYIFACRVLNGARPERPEGCSDAVFKLMQECWQHKPADRPTFAKLKMRIHDAYAADEAARAVQDRDEQGLCVVCLEAQAEYALLPCGHKCVCEVHAVQVSGSAQRRPGECPICRRPVRKYKRIY